MIPVYTLLYNYPFHTFLCYFNVPFVFCFKKRHGRFYFIILFYFMFISAAVTTADSSVKKKRSKSARRRLSADLNNSSKEQRPNSAKAIKKRKSAENYTKIAINWRKPRPNRVQKRVHVESSSTP